MRTPAAWCRFNLDGEEVARAKIFLDSRIVATYPTWTNQNEATRVDRIAVRDDLRGRGFGADVVDLITQNFRPPFVALSRNEVSDRFWGSIGWTEHLHEEHHDGPIGCQRLFTFVG